jgi:hypothetical protein
MCSSCVSSALMRFPQDCKILSSITPMGALHPEIDLEIPEFGCGSLIWSEHLIVRNFQLGAFGSDVFFRKRATTLIQRDKIVFEKGDTLNPVVEETSGNEKEEEEFYDPGDLDVPPPIPFKTSFEQFAQNHPPEKMMNTVLDGVDPEIAEDVKNLLDENKRSKWIGVIKEAARIALYSPLMLFWAVFDYFYNGVVQTTSFYIALVFTFLAFWGPVILACYGILRSANIAIHRFRNRDVSKHDARELDFEGLAHETTRTLPNLADSLAMSFVKNPSAILSSVTGGVLAILAIGTFAIKSKKEEKEDKTTGFLIDFLNDYWVT